MTKKEYITPEIKRISVFTPEMAFGLGGKMPLYMRNANYKRRNV